MISSRHQAYLEAMDIGVWCLREGILPETPATASSPGLKLGPGGGGILLVCAVDSDSASRLASDIGRAMGSNPVWAWPCTDANASLLPKAIEDNLFTTVAIFGEELAGTFFDGELPASLNAANIVLLPAMQDIQNNADARKLLWGALCRSGMVSAGDQQA
jgi:DNA polymerase III psi subunit